MRYQKIHTQIWYDEKFRTLSEDARYLFFYLMTCPHSNAIGAFVLPKKYIEADLEWVSKRLTKPFTELLRNGFIQYDETVNLMVLTNHLKYNKLENPNQVKAAVKILTSLPQSRVLYEVKQLRELLPKQLRERFAKRLPKPETETETETETEYISSISKPIDDRVNQIFNSWNQFAEKHNLPKIKSITNERKRKLRKRLTEKNFDFDAILEKIANSDFLLGLRTQWRVDFNFIIHSEENYTKILEGKYDNNPTAGKTDEQIELEKKKKEVFEMWGIDDE